MIDVEAEAAAREIGLVAEQRWEAYHLQLSGAGLIEKLDDKTVKLMKAAFTQGVAHAFDAMADAVMAKRP